MKRQSKPAGPLGLSGFENHHEFTSAATLGFPCRDCRCKADDAAYVPANSFLRERAELRRWSGRVRRTLCTSRPT